MKRKTKRIFSLLLSLAVMATMLTALPMTGYAADTITGTVDQIYKAGTDFDKSGATAKDIDQSTGNQPTDAMNQWYSEMLSPFGDSISDISATNYPKYSTGNNADITLNYSNLEAGEYKFCMLVREYKNRYPNVKFNNEQVFDGSNYNAPYKFYKCDGRDLTCIAIEISVAEGGNCNIALSDSNTNKFQGLLAVVLKKISVPSMSLSANEVSFDADESVEIQPTIYNVSNVNYGNIVWEPSESTSGLETSVNASTGALTVKKGTATVGVIETFTAKYVVDDSVTLSESVTVRYTPGNGYTENRYESLYMYLGKNSITGSDDAAIVAANTGTNPSNWTDKSGNYVYQTENLKEDVITFSSIDLAGNYDGVAVYAADKYDATVTVKVDNTELAAGANINSGGWNAYKETTYKINDDAKNASGTVTINIDKSDTYSGNYVYVRFFNWSKESSYTVTEYQGTKAQFAAGNDNTGGTDFEFMSGVSGAEKSIFAESASMPGKVKSSLTEKYINYIAGTNTEYSHPTLTNVSLDAGNYIIYYLGSNKNDLNAKINEGDTLKFTNLYNSGFATGTVGRESQELYLQSAQFTLTEALSNATIVFDSSATFLPDLYSVVIAKIPASFGASETDSGKYTSADDQTKGVIRFLQEYSGEQPTSYGFYFVDSNGTIVMENETTESKIENSTDAIENGGFYGDLDAIPEGDGNTYYAKPFVNIDGTMLYGEAIGGSVDWNRSVDDTEPEVTE